MAQTNLSFDDSEEKKISKYKEKWKISKPEVIRKIIREFEEKEVKNG